MWIINDDVLAREVASGFLIARVGWRFMNDANQSGPAASFSVHEGGIFRFLVKATLKASFLTSIGANPK